jgi:coenzyme PQQ precursor peptide PqqA
LTVPQDKADRFNFLEAHRANTINSADPGFCPVIGDDEQYGVAPMQKKSWQKPAVSSTETSLEVTAYLPAELARK